MEKSNPSHETGIGSEGSVRPILTKCRRIGYRRYPVELPEKYRTMDYTRYNTSCAMNSLLIDE